MILQFDTRQRRRCKSFRIVNESNEFFILLLRVAIPGLDSRIGLAPTMGRVMRTDDGGKSMSIHSVKLCCFHSSVCNWWFLSCTRSGGISEVVIDCTDTQLPTTVQCSFNRGPQHPCNLTHIICSASTCIAIYIVHSFL